MIKSTINNLTIVLFETKSRSSLSLTKMTPAGNLKDLISTPENLPVWSFNRIFVLENHRNKGIGTLLLRKLCNIADEKQFAIFLGINAYGDLNTEQLRKWYAKYGWNTIKEKLMIRLPQK